MNLQLPPDEELHGPKTPRDQQDKNGNSLIEQQLIRNAEERASRMSGHSRSVALLDRSNRSVQNHVERNEKARLKAKLTGCGSSTSLRGVDSRSLSALRK